MAEVPLMPERDFPYGNRGYPRERNSFGSGAAIQARARTAGSPA